MRTVNNLQAEIREVYSTIENGKDLKPSEFKKLRKRFTWLRTCVMYLETLPNETSLRRQIEVVESKINLRMLAQPEIPDNITRPQVTKMKREYEKSSGVTLLREQARTLRYLLK